MHSNPSTKEPFKSILKNPDLEAASPYSNCPLKGIYFVLQTLTPPSLWSIRVLNVFPVFSP